MSPDGLCAAAGLYVNGTRYIAVWYTEDAVNLLPPFEYDARSIRFSADSSLLGGAWDTGACIWELSTGNLVWQYSFPYTDAFECRCFFAFSPHNLRFSVINSEKTGTSQIVSQLSMFDIAPGLLVSNRVPMCATESERWTHLCFNPSGS